jgi:hypothetical protein
MFRDLVTRATPWLVAGLLVVLGAWIWAQQAVAFDDAWITYRYAENWVAGHGLVFEPGAQRVEGYSNPLWLAISAAALSLGADPFTVTRALGVGSYLIAIAAVGAGLARHAGALGPSGAWLLPALGCLVLPMGLAAVAGSGLETGFFALCLISLGLSLLLRDDSKAAGPLCLVVPTIACLTRLDALIAVVAVTLADFARDGPASVRRARRRALLRWIPLVVVLVAGFVFRRVYYDAWLPNPFYAKGADEWHLVAGLAYLGGFARSAWQVVPLAGLAGVGAWAARSWRLRRVCVYALLCTLGYALYIAKVGGDFMQYRFAWPPYLVLAAGGLAGLSELARRQLAPAVLLSVAIGTLALLPPVLEHEYAMQSLAEMDDYTQLGLEVGPALDRALPPGTQVATTLAGTISYGSRLRVVDQWGLSDRSVARGPALAKFQRGHYKPATAEYLLGRGVELVIHHPRVCDCADLCSEPAPMLFLRLDAERCLQGFLAAPSEALIAKACAEPERFALHRVDCKRHERQRPGASAPKL